jgi:diguanylate cyclase (GGDEF)-like protein/PAS domain S-box-containing protein
VKNLKHWLKVNSVTILFFLILIGVIFVCELLVMFTLPLLFPQGMNWIVESVTDSTLLSVMVAAVILPFLLRLRQRAQNAEKAIDMTDDGYWVLNTSGNFIDVNEGYCRMVGYSRAEVMGMRISDLETRSPGSEIQPRLKRIMEKGYDRFETQHRNQGGELIDLEITVTFVDERYLVAFLRDISRRKASEAKIQYLAFYDPLSRLPNRRLMQDRLQQAIGNSARNLHQGAVLFLDLDNFKAINDVHGHAAGDTLLTRAAERLRGCVRSGDTVARQGGDEFVIILEMLSTSPIEAAMRAEIIAEKLRMAMAQPFDIGTDELQTSASIGMTLFCGEKDSVGELLRRADIAMYQAKACGRNRLAFYDQTQAQASIETPTESREATSAHPSTAT